MVAIYMIFHFVLTYLYLWIQCFPCKQHTVVSHFFSLTFSAFLFFVLFIMGTLLQRDSCRRAPIPSQGRQEDGGGWFKQHCSRECTTGRSGGPESVEPFRATFPTRPPGFLEPVMAQGTVEMHPAATSHWPLLCLLIILFK